LDIKNQEHVIITLKNYKKQMKATNTLPIIQKKSITKGSDSLPCDISEMTLSQLKAELKKRGIKPTGKNLTNLLKQLDQLIVEEDMILDNTPSPLAEATLLEMVNMLGTKLANVVLFIRELFSQDDLTRIIVFSQHSSFLSRISQVFFECGINNVFIEGYYVLF